jgi:hypothetical protein
MMRQLAACASLEDIMCSPVAFGLPASPLQRAIFRIIQGVPLNELALNPDVRAAVGDVSALPQGEAPREVVILGGVRSGKSLATAGATVYASQHCDVSNLREGEVPRVSILSLDVDKSAVVLRDHLLGTMNTSPLLGSIKLADGADYVRLRHPTGRAIEVKVAAGRRAGGSLVARWSAGVIFDEAARMVGSDEGVVNLDDARVAVLGRLLPGAQILYPSSPWAPFGPIYEMHQAHWGSPTKALVVIRAPGPAMNPQWWTAERVELLKRSDPDAYRTDVLAEFLSPDEALFANSLLEQHTRADHEVLSYDDRNSYCAAMDPATRGNSWTLVIATRDGRRRRVALATQWTGTKHEPLSPSETLREIAEICHRYGITSVHTDQYSIDALIDLARQRGIGLLQTSLTESQKAERYMGLRTKLVEGELELPPLPPLLADLRRVRRKATQAGIAIHLPPTADGRHCDYAPSWMLAMTAPLHDRAPMPEEESEIQRKAMLASAHKRFGEKKKKGPRRL